VRRGHPRRIPDYDRPQRDSLEKLAQQGDSPAIYPDRLGVSGRHYPDLTWRRRSGQAAIWPSAWFWSQYDMDTEPGQTV